MPTNSPASRRPKFSLIAGPQIHAAVERACGARAVRGGRLLREHEVEFQLDVFELRLRNETPTSLARFGLSANDDAVFHFPTGVDDV